MPSDDYRTLTLRKETYDRLVEAVHKAKKKNRRTYTSEFVEMLLNLHEKRSK